MSSILSNQHSHSPMTKEFPVKITIFGKLFKSVWKMLNDNIVSLHNEVNKIDHFDDFSLGRRLDMIKFSWIDCDGEEIFINDQHDWNTFRAIGHKFGVKMEVFVVSYYLHFLKQYTLADLLTMAGVERSLKIPGNVSSINDPTIKENCYNEVKVDLHDTETTSKSYPIDEFAQMIASFSSSFTSVMSGMTTMMEYLQTIQLVNSSPCCLSQTCSSNLIQSHNAESLKSKHIGQTSKDVNYYDVDATADTDEATGYDAESEEDTKGLKRNLKPVPILRVKTDDILKERSGKENAAAPLIKCKTVPLLLNNLPETHDQEPSIDDIYDEMLQDINRIRDANSCRDSTAKRNSPLIFFEEENSKDILNNTVLYTPQKWVFKPIQNDNIDGTSSPSVFMTPLPSSEDELYLDTLDEVDAIGTDTSTETLVLNEDVKASMKTHGQVNQNGSENEKTKVKQRLFVVPEIDENLTKEINDIATASLIKNNSFGQYRNTQLIDLEIDTTEDDTQSEDER